MESSLRGNPIAIFDRIQFIHDLGFETCVPAVIEKVYGDHSALARPLIKLANSSGEISREPMRITTHWNFHGNFEVCHPISVGDRGWIVASDRNTDKVKLMNCENSPIATRGPQNVSDDKTLHKYRFGFFIPDDWDYPADDPDKDYNSAIPSSFYVRNRESTGRFEMFRNGVMSFRSVRHIEVQDDGKPLSVGGIIEFHTEYQFTDSITQKLKWALGDIRFVGNLDISGDIIARTWEASDGTRVGGAVVSTNGKRTATVSSDDLSESDARFREVTVLTGLKEKIGTVVKLFAKRFRVLSDEPLDGDDIVIDVGGGGGEKLTLRYGDDAPVEYDGSEAKTFTVPKPVSPLGPTNWNVDGSIVSVNANLAKTITSNVQGNWEETESSNPSFIHNKPTALPNPQALAIQLGGVLIGTYDGTAAKIVNITQKTIVGGTNVTVVENPQTHVITISAAGGGVVSGYTTAAGTTDSEMTGLEWDQDNHRLVIHKVSKRYENGLLKERNVVADEYIDFVQETV